MLLAIDVGNTQTHFGLFRETELLEHWRFSTVRDATADELATLFANLLELRGFDWRQVDEAIVSSVVPQLAHEYGQISERYLGDGLVIVGPHLRSGMPIRMDNPHEVGTDRLVNAVAAYERFGSACVVVDFGTSTNFDVVSPAGEYIGGVLCPGVEISMEALFQRAAKLTKVEIEPPRSVIGKSTVAALQSGVVYGSAGLVDGIVSRIRGELAGPAEVIATGGLATAIVPFCREVDETDDMLTLTGLRLVWERNRAAAPR
jgi:type III pantothenate kinase